MLAASAFLLPFRRWSMLAAVLFGVPEAIGLMRHRDSLPPLTYVIQRYVPRWLAFPLLRGLLWAGAAWWMGLRPEVCLAVGVTGAADGWISNHFDVTYDARPPQIVTTSLDTM
jgi:hypothetical protein